MHDLVLCEKPSQGKAVAKFLGVTSSHKGYMSGKGYIVTWCIGHLLTLKEPHEYDPSLKKWAMETLPFIPNSFCYKISPSTKGQFAIVKQQLQKARRVIIATDKDREGETIGRTIIEYCNFKGEIQRALIGATDDTALENAFSNIQPGEQTKFLFHAGRCRAIYDWLLGMNYSRAVGIALKGKIDKSIKLSIGGVKIPTLMIVAYREKEIINFKPCDHYGLKVDVITASGNFQAKWVIPERIKNDNGYFVNKNLANELAKKLKGEKGDIHKISKESIKNKPPLAYCLSDLSVDTEKHGLSPKETLVVVQSLYDPPLSCVSYPRTDGCYFPEEKFNDAQRTLDNLKNIPGFGFIQKCDSNHKSNVWNDKKFDAHEGLMPTAVKVDFAKLTQDQKTVYELICRRYAMQFMSDNLINKTKIMIRCLNQEFVSTTNVVIKNGWKAAVLKVKNKPDEKSYHLTSIEEGSCKLVSVDLEAKKTNPPNRYSQASLIKAMGSISKLVERTEIKNILDETDGIGTEATRPETVDSLIKRNLLCDKKGINISKNVMDILDILPKKITSVEERGLLEKCLRAVQRGELTEDKFIKVFSLQISEVVNDIKKNGIGYEK